ALGIRIDLKPDDVARCIDEVGIGFLYAPLLHEAMRYVMIARREMRIRTVFNLLGPLCNPAQATAQVLGVYNEKLTEMMAQVLQAMGARHAFVVHGADGLDEISISGESKVSEVRNDEVRTYYLTPEDFGVKRAPISEIQGGNAQENAAIIRRILLNEDSAKKDIALLNAAAGLAAGGKARTLREGIDLARESIQSGKALHTLERLVSITQKLAPTTN
ncbi:MAG: trpD, partial [Acidobacteria bacterium]|nr:trpD [Acidobacteriota bacterium]